VPGSIWVFPNGLTCIGYTALPSSLATQASTLYSNNKINAGLAARNLVAGGVFHATGNPAIDASCLAASTAMSGVLGVHMTASIGAADLAVVITMLNAYSGLALAAEVFSLDNDLLKIVGTLIASSGFILLYIMCTSMNRSLANVILGGAFTKTNVKSTVVAGEKPNLEHSEATIATVSDALTTAQDNNFICSRDQLAESASVRR
jgi:H+-translocating NAD(P) transhydrogenase